MRGLYIHNVNCDSTSGVCKKIEQMISAFEKHEILIEEIKFNDLINNSQKISKVFMLLNLFKSVNYYDQEGLDLEDIDFAYIRKPIFDLATYRYLRSLKNRGVIVLVEIPTYPYSKEFFKPFYSLLLLLKDFVFRRVCMKYISSLITFSNHNKIFGKKTININNGTLKHEFISNINPDENNVKFIGVCNTLYDYYGYDRFIKSLKNTTKNCNFLIIGEGKYRKSLEDLVLKENLSSKVFFSNRINEAELLNVHLNADIGVCCLGLHRHNKTSGTPLKSREYLSYGLPYIKSYKDGTVDNERFCYNVSSDDETFDIDKIINEFLSNEVSTFKSQIKAFSDSKLTWYKELIPIVSYLRENRGLK